MTLREQYCQSCWQSAHLYGPWMDARDWWSIELTDEAIKQCLYEAEQLGITLAPCEHWQPQFQRYD